MAFFKDTIRLIVQFRDFDGHSITPENVKLTIYDTKQVVIEEITIDIGQIENRFYFDYVIPEHDFIYEFSGVHLEKPVLARQHVHTKFI